MTLPRHLSAPMRMPGIMAAVTDLRADCSRCTGLCCVAPEFARSDDFAVSKPAGTPCLNLQDDYRCCVHTSLRSIGFAGCTVFDCFGAGQRVVALYGGASWSADPSLASEMFDVFGVVRYLHELLWYLSEAGDDDLYAEVEALTHLPPDELLRCEVDEERVNSVLLAASSAARSGARGPNLRGQDLSGSTHLDLAGAHLRGASLAGARLDGCDLRLADLRGASLRGACLAGADLSSALFVTQFQVNEARGSASTRLPPRITRPGYWARTP